MARPLTPLGELGAKVEAALADDGGARERAIELARRRFSLHSLQPQPARRRPSPAWLMVSAAAGLLLAVAFALSFARRAAPLSFNVDGQPGTPQTWLAASSTSPVVLAFSDGTVLDLAPSSRARVADTSANGGNIALESGSIHAAVVHTSHSVWGLTAGPFAVRVTGTRFDLKWDPEAQQLTLAVIEGSVAVSGSIVGGERPVRSGERLVASLTRGMLELSNAAAAAPLLSAAPADTSAPEALNAALPAGASSNSLPAPSSGASKEPAASWRELAKSGDLRRAFAAAEAQGFRSARDAATPSELLLLGDAARLSGRPDRATEALLALRQRYPRDPRRAAAAFALGKVAFDQSHAYAGAAHWFATCVLEQPSGPLAREASGRELEALRNAGDSAGAKRAAGAYLSRYPGGPHADIARSLLQ